LRVLNTGSESYFIVRQPHYQYQQPGQLSLCSSSSLPSNGITGLLFPLARLALVMAYFYLCDRTNFFMKAGGYIYMDKIAAVLLGEKLRGKRGEKKLEKCDRKGRI
jgi:hypothetical protein